MLALAPVWEQAIPDTILDIGEIPAAELPALPEVASTELPALAAGWRIEVTRRGRYWQWRRGSLQNRQSRYGGRFDTLSAERQARYEFNKARRQVFAITQ